MPILNPPAVQLFPSSPATFPVTAAAGIAAIAAHATVNAPIMTAQSAMAGKCSSPEAIFVKSKLRRKLQDSSDPVSVLLCHKIQGGSSVVNLQHSLRQYKPLTPVLLFMEAYKCCQRYVIELNKIRVFQL